MKKAAFYQIQDGDTGAQVAQGLQGNFEALQQEIEAISPYSLPIKMDPNSGIINSEEDYNSILPESYLTEYPWQAEYAGGLPWLWMNFKAKVSGKVLRFALSITTSSASSPTFHKLSAPYLSTRRF